MYRVDLIKNIARMAGIPDINVKNFMEVFFWKVTDVLIGDDVFYLKNLGYFKVNHISNNSSDTIASALKVVIFSETAGFGDDVLVFGVPDTPYRRKEELDSYLSLGIGKPVIPYTAAQFNEKSLLYLPEELEKLYDFKSEEILSKGEFLRNNQPINRKQKTGISFTSTKEYAASTESDLFPKATPTVTRNDWQFEDDWTKELEESELAEKGSDKSLWDEVSDEEESIEYSSEFGEDLAELGPEKITFEDLVEEEFSARQSPAGPFSDTKELKIDLSEFDEESPISKITQEKPSGLDETQNFDLIFKKSMAENVLTAISVPPPPPVPSLPQPDNGEENRDDEEKETEEGQPIEGRAFDIEAKVHELPRRKRAVNLLTSPFKSADKRRLHPDQPAPKSSVIGYLLFFLLCVIIAGGVYYKNYGVPSFIKKSNKPEEIIYPVKRIATIIERDYDIPVTYPYPGSDSKPTESPKSVLPEAVPAPVPELPKETKKTEAIPMDNKPVSDQRSQTPAQIPKKEIVTSNPVREQTGSYLVKGNIFKEGDSFIIQLFSTKSRSEADASVNKLKSQGVSAYVMQADIPNRGTWYRVRVGSFSTLSQAEEVARTLKY